MSATSHAAFDAPPLPRYRYHHKSGTWRKEKVQAADDAANTAAPHGFSDDLHNQNSNTAPHQHTSAGAAANRRGGGGVIAAGTSPTRGRAMHVPFESSYDYFLRSVKPPALRRTPAEREALRRDATRIPLRDFEAALFRAQSANAGGRRLRGGSDAAERGSSASRTRKSTEAAATCPAAARCGGLHPLIGYASTASLPAVYAAMAGLKSHPLNFNPTTSLGDRLSCAEFHTFLAAVGPREVLSSAYADALFRTLPSYAGDTDTVDVLAVLTLLIDHRYHPQFDANVTALFRSFDLDGRDVIAMEAVQPPVLRAWAAVRTFGNLREQWTRFADVMAEEVRGGAVRLPRLPELVSRNAVRAFLTCTDALYAASCTLDLDGGSL